MARQPQRFEGPDLEALLERIRHDLGDAARIVAANRVRRGGLGGFFAREHFEVIVERDDAAKTAVVVDLRDGPEPHATGANSILALAEAVNGTERVRERRRDRRARARGEATVDLVAAEAPISTESERFVEILDRIARDVDDTGLHERAPEDAVLPPEEFIASLRAPAPVEPGPLPAPPAPAKAPAPAVADRPALAQLPADLDGVRPFAPPRVRRSRDLDVIERPENALARLGVPPRFVPRGVVGLQLRGALIESLAQLPAADLLPDATGVVIAVVGLGATPVLLGRALAEERGLDPDNLVIATERQLGDGVPTWLQITDAATADERRRSWRRREHPTLVAVSIPTVGNGDVWARGMLDHLEPTQVWGIVSATWKLEDVQAWADRLGGLDVLALEHLADTVSPAAPMQLDIPIGRLDGRPATPVRWAEILVERLARR